MVVSESSSKTDHFHNAIAVASHQHVGAGLPAKRGHIGELVGAFESTVERVTDHRMLELATVHHHAIVLAAGGEKVAFAVQAQTHRVLVHMAGVLTYRLSGRPVEHAAVVALREHLLATHQTQTVDGTTMLGEYMHGLLGVADVEHVEVGVGRSKAELVLEERVEAHREHGLRHLDVCRGLGLRRVIDVHRAVLRRGGEQMLRLRAVVHGVCGASVVAIGLHTRAGLRVPQHHRTGGVAGGQLAFGEGAPAEVGERALVLQHLQRSECVGVGTMHHTDLVGVDGQLPVAAADGKVLLLVVEPDRRDVPGAVGHTGAATASRRAGVFHVIGTLTKAEGGHREGVRKVCVATQGPGQLLEVTPVAASLKAVLQGL
mmetsp:Transcript_4052/g.9961  ORF Transcript_4052/g.9961 Transcript_4052/m.9961 type:complete len:373 (+) Transcript_4052:64-1182(+)